MIGQSRAGTGKTGAYSIGVLERIDTQSENLQTIILTPTRELTMNIYYFIKCLCEYTKIRIECVVGGTLVRESIKSIQSKRPHIIIATPGRCMDFINKKIIQTDHLKTIVLDEADEMLDKGFIDQIK